MPAFAPIYSVTFWLSGVASYARQILVGCAVFDSLPTTSSVGGRGGTANTPRLRGYIRLLSLPLAIKIKDESSHFCNPTFLLCWRNQL